MPLTEAELVTEESCLHQCVQRVLARGIGGHLLHSPVRARSDGIFNRRREATGPTIKGSPQGFLLQLGNNCCPPKSDVRHDRGATSQRTLLGRRRAPLIAVHSTKRMLSV